MTQPFMTPRLLLSFPMGFRYPGAANGVDLPPRQRVGDSLLVTRQSTAEVGLQGQIEIGVVTIIADAGGEIRWQIGVHQRANR